MNVKFDSMYQLGCATGYLDICLDIISDVHARVFLEQLAFESVG
jgi:hypothetical protein